MMKYVVRLFILCALALASMARPAQALEMTGDIPLPAKTVNGVSTVSWPGTYAELLAADALAMCWTTQQERFAGSAYSFGDTFISILNAHMLASTCVATCASPPVLDGVSSCPPVDRWLQGRQDKTCNIDPNSGEQRALSVKLRATTQTAAYKLPANAALGITGTAATQVRNGARDELAYAELSLCMARHLREKLDSAQVAFSSSADIMQLQEFARERALTAVYKYATIAKTLASTTSTIPTVINSYKYHLLPLGIWGRGTFSSAALWQRIGDDYASAIELLVESTEALVRLKLSSASAQRNFGEQAPYASLDSYALRGARTDMLDILYGQGDTPWYLPDNTHNWSLPGPRHTRAQAVLTDMSAPEIGVLLGLARRASALNLYLQSGGGISVFFPATSASNLYTTVELMLRAEDCASGVTSACPGQPASSILRSRFGITVEDHAVPLVKALAEAALGLPTASSRGDPDIWGYMSTANSNLYGTAKSSAAFAFPSEQRPFHLLGTHSLRNTVNGHIPVPAPLSPTYNFRGSLTIDPNFKVRALRAADRQSVNPQVRVLPNAIHLQGDSISQIGRFRDAFFSVGTYPKRMIGSVPVLALARESILQLGAAPSNTSRQSVYHQANDALPLIESAIGTRQAILRQRMYSVTDGAACSGCVAFVPDYIGDKFYFETGFVTKADDPATDMAYTSAMPNAMTAVLSSSYVSPGLVGGNTIPGLSYSSLIETAADASVIRSMGGATFWLGASTVQGVTVFLRSGTRPNFQYEHVFTGILGEPSSASSTEYGPYGAVVAWSGSFGQMVEQAWEFNPTNWSQPKYDALGLPRDWTPSASAELTGDSSTITEQQHFLDRASNAAREAASSLQQAHELLQQQAGDELSLAAADDRSQQLSKFEYEALCGAKKNCTSTINRRSLEVPQCYGAVGTTQFCESVRSTLGELVSAGGAGVPLQDAVVTQLNASAPTFSDYQGGQLQSLLLSQWNAWKAVEDSLGTAVGTASAVMEDLNSAAAETMVAEAEFASVKADVQAAYAILGAQIPALQLQANQFALVVSQYESQLLSALDKRNIECNEEAFDDAERSGWSYSGEDLWQRDGRMSDIDSRTWSPSAKLAQQQRCEDARLTFLRAYDMLDTRRAELVELVALLQEQADALGPQYEALEPRTDAAFERKHLAEQRWVAALVRRDATMTASYQAVQAAFGQLLGTVPAIHQAYASATLATSRYALESGQVSYDIRSRFGLRSRYRSYDLWRARALNDNARRLAVAARRTIESRYVVDLSQLKASEPFVDAPFLWADEVYSSELGPSSLGLSRTPEESGGTYAHKLVDYVENLRLFLDGYAVQRPTAVVRSDTEILQLGGPAYEVSTSVDGTQVSYVDADSVGWTFYCPKSARWVANPSSSAFSMTELASGLGTVCGDADGDGINDGAPTRARVAFNLDPWGRPGGNPAQPPPTARYNVRLGALAVNLVGTGVHDCSEADDPSACYAQPFIRYDLRQTGPIWVSNYDQIWRSLDVPPAFVEDGKALAVEEWLDPVTNGFNRPDVTNVARAELIERPIGGSYELVLDLPREVRVERIERIQLLLQTHYWVRQQ